MVRNNPYVLQFGQAPAQMIPRQAQAEDIRNAFLSDGLTQHIYMISGIRGAGKTVFMTKVSSFFNNSDWITIHVNISSQSSVIEQILIHLANDDHLKKHSDISSASLNLFGIGVQLSKNSMISSSEYEVQKLLKEADKKHLKILITIDEVSSTSSIKEFAGAFQIWLRENLPVYLLLTGLYENIRELQNDKNLTFLYRSPRIDLSPLQLSAIKDNYLLNLPVSQEEAREMAINTKGYSFAFQALGYVVWKNQKYDEKTVSEYRQILADFSYDKIWSELSDNDQKVCYAIAETDNGEYSSIREILGWQNNQLNPYRKRLIDRQVIKSKRRGYVSFTLPLFKEYLLDKKDEENF